MKRVLLDTHLILWWLAGDRRLGASTRRLIETSACAVSVVSLAEVAMKAAMGKCTMKGVYAGANGEEANKIEFFTWEKTDKADALKKACL